MCQLLGMNCNVPTDIVFSLTGFQQRGGGTDEHEDGWGIAFYEGKGCRLFLDPQAAAHSQVAEFVRNYPIRSLNVVAHIRKATRGPVGLENTHPFQRELARPARFAVGARVRVKQRTPHRHCRIPGYTASRRGVVASIRGGFVFPDTNAHGEGEQPQHLYTVRFDARELWGESAERDASVYVDLFEPYLEVVTERARDVA